MRVDFLKFPEIIDLKHGVAYSQKVEFNVTEAGRGSLKNAEVKALNS